MDDTIEIHLTLTRDTPSSMTFKDTYQDLNRIWYKFETDGSGNIMLSANCDGFEHLARYFLKMARTGKRVGYHAHHTLEYGELPGLGPEVIIALADAPTGFFGPE